MTSEEVSFEKESEDYYKSLSKEEQLKVFCAVVRRIHKASLEDKGTFRYTLYDVFDFGPDAYWAALEAGYMAIHNGLYNEQDVYNLKLKIKQFLEENNVPQEKVDTFLSEITLW